MAALSKKLQAQTFYTYQSQQALSLYRYKEFELQTGPLGARALQVSFSDWLLPRQGKCGCNALFCFLWRNEDEKEKLLAENTWIFHCLQFSLTNATLLGLFILASLSPLHQVLICGTHALPHFRRFQNCFQTKLIDGGLYLASIGSMRLQLQEL